MLKLNRYFQSLWMTLDMANDMEDTLVASGGLDPNSRIELFDGDQSKGGVIVASNEGWYTELVNVADGLHTFQARGVHGTPRSQEWRITKVGSKQFDEAPVTLLALNSPVEILPSKLEVILEVYDEVTGPDGHVYKTALNHYQGDELPLRLKCVNIIGASRVRLKLPGGAHHVTFTVDALSNPQARVVYYAGNGSEIGSEFLPATNSLHVVSYDSAMLIHALAIYSPGEAEGGRPDSVGYYIADLTWNV